MQWLSRFCLLLLFGIHKMVNIMDIYKSLIISIGTIIKNLEMLKFGPYRLKHCTKIGVV